MSSPIGSAVAHGEASPTKGYADPGFIRGSVNPDPRYVSTSGFSTFWNDDQSKMAMFIDQFFEDDGTCKAKYASLISPVQKRTIKLLKKLQGWETEANDAGKTDAVRTGPRYKLMYLKKSYGVDTLVGLAEKIATAGEEMDNKLEGMRIIRDVDEGFTMTLPDAKP